MVSTCAFGGVFISMLGSSFTSIGLGAKPVSLFRRQAFQFVLECQRLGARLEPNRPAGRNLFLMPDAIGKRPNALPQQVADRSCFRTI
jgi:hypothetical protein